MQRINNIISAILILPKQVYKNSGFFAIKGISEFLSSQFDSTFYMMKHYYKHLNFVENKKLFEFS